MVQERNYAWTTFAHRIYFRLYDFSLYWPWPTALSWYEVSAQGDADGMQGQGMIAEWCDM